jgi:hypothetical protein
VNSGVAAPTSFREPIPRGRHKQSGSIRNSRASIASVDVVPSAYPPERPQSTATVRPPSIRGHSLAPSRQPSERDLRQAQYAQEHRSQNPSFTQLQLQQPPGPVLNGRVGSNVAYSQYTPSVMEDHGSAYDASFTQGRTMNYNPTRAATPSPPPMARTRTRESAFARPPYQEQQPRHRPGGDGRAETPTKRVGQGNHVIS